MGTERLGIRVMRLRERLGLSQERAAQLAGISDRTWVRVEGNRGTTLKTLDRMACVLGVTVSALLFCREDYPALTGEEQAEASSLLLERGKELSALIHGSW